MKRIVSLLTNLPVLVVSDSVSADSSAHAAKDTHTKNYPLEDVHNNSTFGKSWFGRDVLYNAKHGFDLSTTTKCLRR